MKKKEMPRITTNLRKEYVKVPEVIQEASGIYINGKAFKSLLFTTDIAIIMNNNADAVLCVYPFTPHPAIIESVTAVSNEPVIAGVGGGLTSGARSANMALFAESHGCQAVIVNAPTSLETVEQINEMIDIPIIMTVVSEYANIEERLAAGVDIINVSGAQKTVEIVRHIREKYPDVPIIATGGKNEETIQQTIEAGANAIIYTPPSTAEIFSARLKNVRAKEREQFEGTQE
jgi:CheY-like chemotaxis protein